MNGPTRVTPDDDLGKALARSDEGDSLLVSRGRHVVDEPLRNDVNGITIHGEGMDQTVITRSGDFPLLELEGTQRRGDRREQWAFRGLTLQATQSGESDLIRSRNGGNHRFENIRFHGDRMIGNGVFLEEVWDQRFTNCLFDSCGDPETGTADVFVYNGDYDNSNALMFVNCTWIHPASHAIYSDSSGKGTPNDRFYLANCKFLGAGRGGKITEDPEVYYIDGTCRELKIVNSHFRWSIRGFVRNDPGGGAVQISNCMFQQYGDHAVDLRSGGNAVSNSIFESDREGSTAIRAAAPGNSIQGCRVDDAAGLVVEGDRAHLTDNTVDAPAGDAITIDADDCVVRANAIRDPGGDGIAIAGSRSIVGANRCVAPGGSGIALSNARHVMVSGNLIRDPGDRSIASRGDSDCLFVTNNMALGDGSDDIDLAGDGNEVATNFVGSSAGN